MDAPGAENDTTRVTFPGDDVIRKSTIPLPTRAGATKLTLAESTAAAGVCGVGVSGFFPEPDVFPTIMLRSGHQLDTTRLPLF
jgi:hypothetical protein